MVKWPPEEWKYQDGCCPDCGWYGWDHMGIECLYCNPPKKELQEKVKKKRKKKQNSFSDWQTREYLEQKKDNN